VVSAPANDGDSVRISRTNAPWFVIQRVVMGREGVMRIGVAYGTFLEAPRLAPGHPTSPDHSPSNEPERLGSGLRDSL
jgi:hypothetical protein